MDELRPAKRARIACIPCRRKKSKCPGEQPSCSYCVRLKQTCFYSTEQETREDHSYPRTNQDLESRMGGLEAKLDTMMRALTPLINNPSLSMVTPPERPPSIQRQGQSTEMMNVMDMHSQRRPSPNTSLLQAGRTYLKWCHNQPVGLFNPETFLDSLSGRDEELRLAIQALSCRFPPGSLDASTDRQMKEATRKARRIIYDRIADGNVTLSTLQALCLLSIIEFSDGDSVRAGLDLNTAEFLSKSLHGTNYLQDAQEFHDCAQSILVLQNCFGTVVSRVQRLGALVGRFQPLGLSEPSLIAEAPSEADARLGIMWYSSQLSHVWKMVREYAACQVHQNSQKDHLPPWNPQSDYASVTLRHLELDSKVPLKYRYAANDFAGEPADRLQDRRDYWGPYLSLQLIYAAIPCLLNHPFLLSLRLRHFRYTMPQMFIHQCFELINRHTGWIMHFVDLVEKQSFQISEPTLAHCVVIVATIHLQHSFVKDSVMREKAQASFEKCLMFLQRMGAMWPSVSTMVENLKLLQQSVVSVPSPSSTHADGSEGRMWSIDDRLLWNLLIYETAGRPGAQVDQSIFGPSLKSANPRDSSEASLEFDLVGSTGISGHRSNPKEVPVYAPGERAATEPSSNLGRPNADFYGTLEDRVYEGWNGLTEQEGIYLQVNDFGRAIDDWLTLDIRE